MRRAALATLAGLSLAATTVAAVPAQAAGPAHSKLARLVKLKNVRHHQLNLQKIADANGGNRAAGLPGNKITIKYIADQLKRAGYSPTVQNFTFDFWQEQSEAVFAETAPEAKTFAPGTDFATMQYSGSGDVTAAATPVDSDATGVGSGCEADDFAGFPAGHIALIQRGGCFFSLKTDNAIAASASAVVIYQLPDQPGPVAGTLTTPYDIPVIGPTNAVGRALVDQANNGGVTLRVKTDVLNDKREASNVIADTKRGRSDNVVVVGAHNDSVIDGPGINDDGSGTATLLEMAKQIRKLGPKVRNTVRFAFWGAEEEGCSAPSTTSTASPGRARQDRAQPELRHARLAQLRELRLRRRQQRRAEQRRGARRIRRDREGVQRLLREAQLATDPTPFNGRSDYNAFITVGIPAGACSPAPRASRRPSRRRPTAAPPGWPTTRATTRRATATTT